MLIKMEAASGGGGGASYTYESTTLYQSQKAFTNITDGEFALVSNSDHSAIYLMLVIENGTKTVEYQNNPLATYSYDGSNLTIQWNHSSITSTLFSAYAQ